MLKFHQTTQTDAKRIRTETSSTPETLNKYFVIKREILWDSQLSPSVEQNIMTPLNAVGGKGQGTKSMLSYDL